MLCSSTVHGASSSPTLSAPGTAHARAPQGPSTWCSALPQQALHRVCAAASAAAELHLLLQGLQGGLAWQTEHRSSVGSRHLWLDQAAKQHDLGPSRRPSSVAASARLPQAIPS